MLRRNISILLIEDDMDDVELLEEALTNIDIDFTMEVIMEGDQVTPYLERQTLTSIPDIIVMDLNIPKADGREIIKNIKATPVFKMVPLVVFSTSSARDDIDYSYRMGANKFITKPVTMDGWNDAGNIIIKQILKQDL